MIYFSSLLKTDPTYKPAADNLFAALDCVTKTMGYAHGSKKAEAGE